MRSEVKPVSTLTAVKRTARSEVSGRGPQSAARGTASVARASSHSWKVEEAEHDEGYERV